jgi:hypothetical protein
VGSVVVAVDVGGDLGAGLVDGLELVQPDAALLQFLEPGLDERLRLGIAVAASAMSDPATREGELEVAGGEGGAVVGAERERAGPDRPRRGGVVDERDRLGRSAAELGVREAAKTMQCREYEAGSRFPMIPGPSMVRRCSTL